MARVTGYMADELSAEYITTGGRVLISGDATIEVPLESNGAFLFEDVDPGSYVVSILEVRGYNPSNKLLDVTPSDEEIDLGWFQGKAIPKSMWGVHNDYEEV